MKIIGAGLAGLIAGVQFPKATIYEKSTKEQINHKALLRFRTPAVGDMIGVEFKKVTVHKGIWFNGSFVQPDPLMCNLYSQKVAAATLDRSIWNIDTCTRYIAPESLIEELIDRCGDRISWNHDFHFPLMKKKEMIISTIPMNVICNTLCLNDHGLDFKYKPIKVRKFKVEGANVYQTIYYPDPTTCIYRASLSGDIMTVESIDERSDIIYQTTEQEDRYQYVPVFKSFGLTFDVLKEIGSTSQKFGKIKPIDDNWRKNFIYKLTTEHNIYSLGRFATWRNILLDDVLKDTIVLKKMMKLNSYDRTKESL